MLNAVWHYRGFILGSVKREFRLRYNTSTLGTTWAVLNPLALVVIYTVVFSQVMNARLPGAASIFGYGMYLCAGILCWNCFTEVSTRCMTVFIDNSNLIRKLAFPRLCLPLIVAMSSAVNFSIMLLILVAFKVFYPADNLALLSIIPLFALQMLFSLGLGVILGVLNVFFRDVGQFFTIVFQFWFWLTPIVYPISILPEKIQTIVHLNPITPLVGAYQTVFVYGAWPQWETLFSTLVVTLVLLSLAFFLYRKCSVDMVDML